MTGQVPGHAWLQLALITLLYIISSSMVWFLVCEVLVQVIVIGAVFYQYWGYVR